MATRYTIRAALTNDIDTLVAFTLQEAYEAEGVEKDVEGEWSDFHGGYYWWIHSLFIVPEHRGSGLLEVLLDHLEKAADEAGALDLRLYAHTSNARALRAYRRCGFTVAPYTIMTRALKQRRSEFVKPDSAR